MGKIMKEKVLFIWIPKTAGTSFYSILKDKLNMQLFTEGYHRFDNNSNVTFGHACVNSLMDKNIIKPYFIKKAHIITVIRNPYDRFVSLFNDYKRTGRIPPNFSQWDFANTLRNVTRKPGLYNSIDFSMCANQSDWFVTDAMIIKLEQLNQICKLQFNLELPTLNCSEDNVFDENCLDIVGDIYNKDFCLLNY